jgi:hypothetical protein
LIVFGARGKARRNHPATVCFLLKQLPEGKSDGWTAAAPFSQEMIESII